MRVRAVGCLVFALTLSGCSDSSDGDGDGGDPDAGTCSLRADLSGGLSFRFTGKSDAGCATQHSFDTGLDVAFIAVEGQHRLDLWVNDVVEGGTGEGFPAVVTVLGPASQRWRSSTCVASVTEHDLVGVEASELGELRRYQVAGEGSCAEALERVSGDGEPLTLGALRFRARFTWRD